MREALAARGAAPPRALLSAGLVGAVTALAMKLTDLGLVAGISGAIVSTGISYILPSVMFGQMLASKVRLGDTSRRVRIELIASRFITALGVAFGAVGLYAAF